ncbi:MAG TPA: phage portal protein [Aurantimonas coralicida]|uniref:Phage portal protein n=1 Tax=Aurantimonas coralicida TaxID=182270 RepID=A0A9C9TFM4_9HYPH|nr:phage portal protein [Aurantimonas coralicida]
MTQASANLTTSIDTVDMGTIPALPAVAPARQSSSASSASQYITHPTWGQSQRSFESAGTTRLNQAHWRDADDRSVNVWLASQLATVRSRAAYEARQNSTILGVINTHCDDIVGPSGPTLQVISGDKAYDDALEAAWRQWFRAPTHKRNVSGAAWLKLCIRSLWKNGEFLNQIITDKNADSPVEMRVRPIHPRRLVTPVGMTSDPRVFMGIQFDSLGRAARYFVHNPIADVRGGLDKVNDYKTISPDDIIHEFLLEEEDQARGIPWSNTSLVPAADLRDYDDQVQDAARQMADQSVLLYTNSVDVPVWDVPESTTIERRTIKMAPPGWQPAVYPATQPPVQYPEYRGERQREFGRQVGMPLLMVRLDSGKHNYSSARLDTQGYARAVAGIQQWLSGDEQNVGTLSRLVDEVAKESRFSVPALRSRPATVKYVWTWPRRPHVDPLKESLGEMTSLNKSGTITGIDALADRGETLETHIAKQIRERDAYVEAGLPVPARLREEVVEPSPGTPSGAAASKQKETANAS